MRRGALRHLAQAALGLWLLAGAATGTSPHAAGAPARGERFDFRGGAAFPPRARVRIGDVAVPPGARAAFVPITLDRPTPNTIHARVMTRNGQFPDPALEGRHYRRLDTTVIFRPGDPLVQTLRVALVDLPPGPSFEVHFPEGVDGAEVADARGRVSAAPGARAGAAQTRGFRPPRRFVPAGAPDWVLDPPAARWSDRGGPGVFATRLPHGRTQTGNGETGLYLDPQTHRAPAAPIAVEGGALVLRSQQLGTPIAWEGRSYRHGAAVLTGERMPETHLTYGQVEWEAWMPDRRGSWPALWLLPVNGWPPEIDVYEGFGESPGWDFDSDISANLHGGARGKRSFTAPLRIDARRFYGLTGFASGWHRYAVDIAPDFITWFVDGREVYQAVNPFAGTRWFPLMNVAVKREGDYSGGNAAMRVRALRIWRSGEGGRAAGRALR
ncbi:family 16 glycosylhydrolase [Erythrobacter sp. NE805]|uniref:glycoside hydrolase family 16 protein n=1 Tax=Erythrobacter sp. NE805 TaxID=3389875 RepID=UPI00396B00A8